MVGNCGLTMVHWGDSQFDDDDRDDHKNLIYMIHKIKRYLDVEKKPNYFNNKRSINIHRSSLNFLEALAFISYTNIISL